MIKLYDLVFEANAKRQPNYAADNLGDKNEEFEEKLALMPPEASNKLIAVVNRLKGSRLKEFKNLLNKYPNVKDLKGVKTPLEKKIARIDKTPYGPGETLFHLELQDSKMDVGRQTNHDLVVKGKVWEVKMVDGIAPNKIATSKPNQPMTGFRLAKKGKASQFKFNMDLLKTVMLLDRITKDQELEEDLNDISPRLRKALDIWKRTHYKKTPRESILLGDHTAGFKNNMIKLINIIKSEIETNTDDEFTNVRFGGVGIAAKEKGINPISIQKVDDDSVTLNFIGKDTLKAIEILNDLPYAEVTDFENDMEAAVFEALEDMPSMIIWGKDGRILIVEKDKFKEVFKFGGVTQGNLIVRVKDEIWKKA
jgi:hypothetical protein